MKKDPLEYVLITTLWLMVPIMAVLGIFGVILVIEYFRGGFGSHC